MRKALLIILFASVIVPRAVSQDTCHNITFQKVFQISKYSAPWEVMQTKEGGYLISGIQSEEPTGNGDGLLLKTNKYGETQWIKGMNRTELDYVISSSTQLPDSSFISTVQMFFGTEGLQKTDKNGNIIWQKSLNDPAGNLSLHKVLANPDGSFLVTANVLESIFPNTGGTVIIKFDGDGNILWRKKISNGDHSNYPVDIFISADTLFVNGTLPSYIPNVADSAYIMKVAVSDGAVYDARKVWLDNIWIEGHSFLKSEDGKYKWVINFVDIYTGESWTVVSNLNPNFDLVQSVKILNLPGDCTDASPSHDNGFVMLYQSYTESASYFIKFAENLNPIFAKKYSPLYRDNLDYYLGNIVTTQDSGFVIAGYKWFGDSSITIMMKTDALGNTGSCATTPIISPTIETTTVNTASFTWETITTPDFVKQDYEVVAIIPNNSDSIFCSNSTCDKSCTIYAPNGKIYICHVPPGDPGNSQQLILPLSAVNAHLSQHPEDRVGLCGQNCSNVTFRLNTNNVLSGEVLSKPAVSAIIYPNPTSNSFSLRLNGTASKPLFLNVISLDGRVVYKVQKPSSLNEINFGHNLLPGTYFVEIRFSDKREVFKVIKLK